MIAALFKKSSAQLKYKTMECLVSKTEQYRNVVIRKRKEMRPKCTNKIKFEDKHEGKSLNVFLKISEYDFEGIC